MDAVPWAVLSIAVLVAGFVQGATGMGFALVVAPVVGLLEPKLLPVAVLLLMLPLNVYVVGRERAALAWVGTRWITAGRLEWRRHFCWI